MSVRIYNNDAMMDSRHMVMHVRSKRKWRKMKALQLFKFQASRQTCASTASMMSLKDVLNVWYTF